MNPAMILTLKKKWEEFSERHPKFAAFLHQLAGSGVGEGSVIDITVTLPDGRKMQSNMRLSAEDVELIQGLMK